MIESVYLYLCVPDHLNTVQELPAVSQLSGYFCLLMSLSQPRQEFWELLSTWSNRYSCEGEEGGRKGREKTKKESRKREWMVHEVHLTFSTHSQSNINTVS